MISAFTDIKMKAALTTGDFLSLLLEAITT